MTKELLILYGGKEEAEISYRSAINVFKACHSLGYYPSMISVKEESIESILRLNKDAIILNLVHGKWGEDGKAQALFESLGMKYFGSSPKSCELTFNKILFREKMCELVNMPNGRAYSKEEYEQNPPSYIHVVKPYDSGSTMGVHYVETAEDVKKVVAEWSDNNERIVEEFIGGREGAVIVYNGEVIGGMLVNFDGPIFTYEAKYTPELSRLESWDCLHKLTREEISKYSLIVYNECGCEGGFLCIDFRLSASGDVYIIEANSIPGMTDCSLTPYSFGKRGVNFNELVQLMINSASLKQMNKREIIVEARVS